MKFCPCHYRSQPGIQVCAVEIVSALVSMVMMHDNDKSGTHGNAGDFIIVLSFCLNKQRPPGGFPLDLLGVYQ